MEVLLGLRGHDTLEKHTYPANRHGITWDNTRIGFSLNNCMYCIAQTFEDNCSGERLRNAYPKNDPLVIITNDRATWEAGHHWFVIRCSWRQVARRTETATRVAEGNHV